MTEVNKEQEAQLSDEQILEMGEKLQEAVDTIKGIEEGTIEPEGKGNVVQLPPSVSYKEHRRREQFSRDLLSSIVSTSDYAVLRSALDHLRDSLTDETMVVVIKALETFREELLFEIKVSGPQWLSIPKHVDLLDYIGAVEASEFEAFTKAMEEGWDGKVHYHKPTFGLSNVGWIRAQRGRKNSHDEFFGILDTMTKILEETKDMTDPTEDEVIMMVAVTNNLALMFCTETTEQRLAIADNLAQMMTE